MASTSAARSAPPPLTYVPSIHGLRRYYRVRNHQIAGGRMGQATSQKPGSRETTTCAAQVSSDDHCPDTSDWAPAETRNSDYIHAQHVAMSVCESLAVKYPILHDRGRQGHDATDSGGNVYSRVVKYKIMPSTNPQDQHETDYYLKIEVDARQFTYIIAHVSVTNSDGPLPKSTLQQTWTTNR